jgi:NCS1 family nucleobase:cation symporter-1
VIRKRELDAPDLYRRGGRYEYSRGINWVAMIALVAGILPNLPGFLGAIGATQASPLATGIYEWAWFVGVGVAALVYFIGMSITARGAKEQTHANH